MLSWDTPSHGAGQAEFGTKIKYFKNNIRVNEWRGAGDGAHGPAA